MMNTVLSIRRALLGLIVAVPMFSATIDIGQVQAQFNGGGFSNVAVLAVGTGGALTFTGSNPDPQAGLSTGDAFAISNLGTLAITTSTTDVNLAGNTLDLLITFISPTGIVGGQTVVYNGTISGQLNAGGGSADAAIVTFTPSSKSFNYEQGLEFGSFTLNLQQPFSANSSTTAQLDAGGVIQFGQVPEPGTYALLGSSLLVLGFLRRRAS